MEIGVKDGGSGKFCLNNCGNRYPPCLCDDHILCSLRPVVVLNAVEAKGDRAAGSFPRDDIERILDKLPHIVLIATGNRINGCQCCYGFTLLWFDSQPLLRYEE